MSPPRPWWHRALLGLVRWPLALIILFEEWGWGPLQRALAAIGQWPGFRWAEAAVRRLPPYAALALFLLPSLLLLPVKLGALWLIGHGKAVWGALLILTAKLVGTAIVARLFTLTQPALMQLAWFARLYGRWTVWKDALLVWVRASAAWRAGRVLKAQVRRLVRRLFGRG
ncbi:MAG: hypothetical protein U5L74_09540 [Ideonella sp.]|nr:hypothetical protein [Ideonella sp.]